MIDASKLVMHTRFKDAWDLLLRIHQLFVEQQRILCAQITGPEGVGKTALGDAFAALFPVTYTETHTIRHVVHVEIPASPNADNFWTALNGALGDPAPTAAGALQRFCKMFKEQQGQLLILGEFHHLLDRGRLYTHSRMTDIIKELMNMLHAPVVITGAMRMTQALVVNNQLRGRFPAHRILVPFNVADDDGDAQLEAYLEAVLEDSVFKNKIFFQSKTARERLFYATDGTPRGIYHLLTAAEDVLQSTDQSKLSLDLLCRAFLSLRSHTPVRLNPFSKEFVMRRLINPGEIYEISPVDGDPHAWLKTPISGAVGTVV